MATYRILSIDGGGIRGVLTAVVLQRLSDEPSLNGWLDSVDLLAGTSTGGLLALAIANNLGLDTIRDLYVTKGEKIFNDSLLDEILDLFTLLGANYNISNLKRELENIFGQTTLDQLQKRVLITTFNLDNESEDPVKRSWKPKLFHNFPGSDNDGDELAYKVGLYTSAAPTYFQSFDGFIDGGVYAPNPSMCALAQTQDPRNPNDVPLSNIVLLSLGTGTSLDYISGKNHDWGYVQWAKPLVTLTLEGVSGIADYQCNQILRQRYHRCAPTFLPGVSIPMDAVKKIPYMIDFAMSLDLTETIKWIKDQWM